MRHTSTCASRWYLSGPLQMGHARISSRRESMERRYLGDSADHGINPAAQPGADLLEQLGGLGIAEARADGHIPQPRVREGAAFYGIFLCHEHGRAIAEIEIGGGEGMMVGKCVLDE